MHVCECKRLPMWTDVRMSIRSSLAWLQGTDSLPSAIAPGMTGESHSHPLAYGKTWFNVKNTAQTLSDCRFNECDHVPIGCVRRPSFTVFQPGLNSPQDRDCAPVPSGAPEETQVGWIQSLLYPSSMMIGQKNVSDTSRCRWT